ncbi:RING finger protein [Purpureocillium lilacinum]|nr:RING finger protein [Purpureocillium lilacinum]OAQ86502.1 RING finger protein [Purpureocillium lilacinum]OAQ94465.1 RING finger protein [Purpureocillium lilacinum]GJN67262.1 E3 ubiquitin-protein ligase hrd1 [Purpureocillium lilacinum]GJN81171.1 E3 ubiquitin-protein ligase hrd1 [Purpureocillium lilacinum]
MRLGWYAGVSTALAGGVIVSAFQQRANFYSAMVYLAQSNFCLLALVNFTLLLYSSFIYGLTRLCYGTLRAVEVEQLTERAWFAITETCLAMTIFREEIGAWFLVMFTALVTGKVWGWIGDGRVEFLEQQPPPNPRLFHLRLSVSLTMSFLYDVWILRYTINSVIQQARPNMMVMFLFEFAVLATCSWRTGARYILSLAEQNIIQTQTRKRLLERRQEVRERREALIRDRELAAAAGQDPPTDQEPLPSEDDIDEMDIEVPGWAAKGEWVLWLDLLTDMIKLGIYVAFFVMLLTFYGLPIHIMRDLFMTSRDFVKRLNALLRYRRAIQEMNRYHDATADDLAQENTCIICREEMRPWDPASNPGAIDRIRPKKLPCGHILHLGCLKSWLERQQVCPTCRSPVTADRPRGPQQRGAGLRIQFGGRAAANAAQQPAGGAPAQDGQGRPNEAPQPPGGQGPRVFNLGPIRLGFGANGQQVRELAQQFGMPQIAGNQAAAQPTPTPTQQPQATLGDNLQSIGSLIQQSEQMVQREMQRLQVAQQELQVAHLLMAELQRLQQRRQQPPDQAQPHGLAPNLPPNFPFAGAPQFHMPTPGAPGQFVGLPPLPGMPARTGSPLLARFAAPSANPVAVPAGSPDLPEGLALPAGWSLVPLQRTDVATSHTQAAPQTSDPAMTAEGVGASRGPDVSSNEATVGTSILAQSNDSGSNNGPVNSIPGQDVPSTAATAGSSPSRPLPDDSAASTTDTGTQATGQTSGAGLQTPVVAPSPMMPNWGGSAQLFNNARSLDPGENAHSQAPAGDDMAGHNGHEKERSDGDEPAIASPETRGDVGTALVEDQSAGPSVKGKARAVTVEEAQDEQE